VPSVVPPVIAAVSAAVPIRTRCRYGANCYRGEDHRAEFAHPGDDDWDQTAVSADEKAPPRVERNEHDESKESAGNADKADWMCITPACRKPNWNGMSGEYCSRACRDGPQQAMSEDGRGQGKAVQKEKRTHQVESASTTDCENHEEIIAEKMCRSTVAAEWLGCATDEQLNDLAVDLEQMKNKFGLRKATILSTVVDDITQSSIELVADNAATLKQAHEELCTSVLEYHRTLLCPISEPVECTETVLNDKPLDDVCDVKLPAQPPCVEERIDPSTGQVLTWKALYKLYRADYSRREVDDYWQSMELVAQAELSVELAPETSMQPVAQAEASAKPVPETSSFPSPVDEALPGLSAWLVELCLTSYAGKAAAWVEEQGACSLREIQENFDEFAEDLGLKRLERQRLEKYVKAHPMFKSP